MLEKIVQKILNPILSQYVEDFNSQNMKIGLWSGQVVIKNVKLRKQIIKKLNLPFKLKYSRLGILKMNIPWKSLSTSKIDIIIEGLQLLITQVNQKQWQCKNNKIIEKRKQQIMNYCESIIQDFAKKSPNASKQDEDKGYFGNLVSRILDNLQITIKDIHVRYQDQITKKYSFGVTLQELKIFTVNKKGEPEFIDRTKKQYENQPLRKKLILSNFGLYWNENSQFYQDPQPHNNMISDIARNNQTVNSKMNYLILMSSNAELYQRDPGKQYLQPQINLFIDFEELKIKITNQQLQQIITMSQRLQNYINKVKAQNSKKLTQQQMKANYKQFMKLFPVFLDKKTTPQQLNKIQTILQKMETQNFQQGMKTYLQTKQKQKMVQQKMEKNRGWFSKPKQLTEQQMKQIEDFVKSNFGVETKIVKRPQQFYYIRVDFKLKLLNIAIANTKKKNKNQQGINVSLQQILIGFNLREGGYLLNFGMENILVDLYSKPFDKPELETISNILQKLPIGNKKIGQYATLKVVGSPLDKKHLDTQLILRTEELLLQFDPRIIKIAKDFADIKINSKNTQAAIEAYGQMKNKVTIAASSAAQNISKTEKKKTLLSLDVCINTVYIVLFFDPLKIDGDIWVINLGQTDIYSDAEALKKPEFTPDEPIQKYTMKTENMSMIHYQNKQAFIYTKTNDTLPNPKQIVLQQLGVDFEIQMFKKSNENRPSIRAKTTIHNLDLNLTSSTYISIQKIGDCFSIPIKAQPQTKQQIQQIKANQKAEIMKQQTKIGILYEQSSTQPKKYIGVLSGGYIYLYADRKDVQYSNYYYVRNSKFSIQKQQNLLKKPFSLVIDNKINKIRLGFDKQISAQEWSKAIKALQTHNQYTIQSQDQKAQNSPVKKEQINPNNLNFQVIATIERISINTLLYSDRKAYISIHTLTAHAKLHETKTVAKITLKQIKISDNIYNYKYKELTNFLYSESIEGKQKLIDIDFIMLSQQNPAYQKVDMVIGMEVGKLVCNYKPQTVQNLMRFFLPKTQPLPSSSKELTAQDKKSSSDSNEQHKLTQQQIRKRKIQKQLSLKTQPQKYKLKLNLKIQEISIALINRKTKVMFSKVGLTNFKLQYGMSNKKIDIIGAISELYLNDYSNYPNTIIMQQEQYKQYKYIVQSYNKSRDMVTFDIQILEYHNETGKNMLIKAGLYDLAVSYIQQPVLRLITYLTDQLLPSLTPTGQANKPRVLIVHDTKPEYPTMELFVDLQNILAVVQPRTGQDQYLKLLIKKIAVKNTSHQKLYIKNPTNQSQKVLIQNYEIKLNGISIIQKYNNKQNKLSNDMNIDLNCQLIQNTLYYTKTYGKRYEAGMRISCKISPFLMRLNHDDYNFIMKCLNWNITYDDNADGYLFDSVIKQTQNKQIQAQNTQPFYCNVEMDRIILCVTQNNIPITTLFLSGLKLQLNLDPLLGMKMIFQMSNMFGTRINQSSQENVSIERGMFNLFGYQKNLNTKQLYDIEKLVQIYSLERIKENTKSLNIQHNANKPVILMEFQSDKSSNMFINLRIQGLKIAIQLKNLLILSKLAITDSTIIPPKSTLNPILKKVNQTKPAPVNAGKSIINICMTDFLGSVADKSGKNYMVMQGQFIIKLKMQGSKPQDQIITKGKSVRTGRFMDLSAHIIQLRNFSLYFCNINNLKNKRYVLLPLKLYLVYGQQYGIKQDIVYLQTDIDGQLDRIVIQASLKDMIMINKIIQDNLHTLSQFSTPKKQQKQIMQTQQQQIPVIQARKTQISSLKKFDVEIDKQAIEKTVKSVQKKIKDKMKANITMQPIQIKIINDCNNNFMPVISFVIQESNLLFSSDAIKTHLAQAVTMNLDFFNPRSAKWEPVIQTFKLTLDYLTLMTQYGSKTKIIISSAQIQQLKQLKINVSTQLVATLLTTLQITKNQNKKIQQIQSQNQIQVSPYIMQNKTNKLIKIERFLIDQITTFQLQPLYKGPVKLTDKAEQLVFQYLGKKYSVPLEKFGLVIVPGLKDIHLNFRMEKLNRVIVFVNNIVIQNATINPLYCIRYNEKKQTVEQKILLQPGQILPCERDWFAQFSFNMKSFTYHTKITQLLSSDYLRSQSQKFKLAVTQKKLIMGHSKFMIRAPFVVQNCLPKNMQIQFICNGKQVSSKSIAAQTSHQVYANQQMSNLKFKILCEGFYWSPQFLLNYSTLNNQCYLFLSDRQDGGTTIKYVFQKDQIKRQFKLSLYCPAFIVSQLDCDLQIYSNNEREQVNKGIQKYYKLGGQTQYWKKQGQNNHKKTLDKRILVGTQSGSKIRVCGRNCLVDFSQPISTKNIGVSQTRIVIETEVHGKMVSLFTVLGVQVELKKMSLKSDIYSRKITLRSKCIFFNNSGFDLEVKQLGGDKFYYRILKDEKKPFLFIVPQIKQKPKSLIFRTQMSLESVPVLINSLGALYFRLESQTQSKNFIYFKLNIQQIQSYLFYQITSVSYQDLPYQVVVKSDKLEAYIPQFQYQLRKDSNPLLFINQMPTQPYNLQVLVRLIGGKAQKEALVQADNLNFKQKLTFYEQGITETFIMAVVYVIFNDNKKFIVIDQMYKDPQELPQYQIQTINFKLQRVSLSIIQNHTDSSLFESFFFYMSNLQFVMQKTNKRTGYQAKLQFIQFDQDQPFNIANPVIITPIKYKQFTSTDPKDKPKSIFNALVQIDNSFVKNLFINRLVVEVNDIVIKIGSPFIKLILDIYKQYVQVAKGQNQFLIKNQIDTWKKLTPPPIGSKTFIKSIRIAPFTLLISAQIRFNELDQSSVVLFSSLLSALGVVMTNIEDAPIVLDGIVLNDCNDTLQGLTQKLVEHYQGSVMRQLYKIFGSLNILGNPVSLFMNISSGFKDLKEKPSEGFVQGPLEFGLGLAQGTTSLITHSIGGALNSVSNVTGALASGLAALTFDKEFQQKRQRQKMKKPKHVFQGLQKGGKAVFHGFKEGLTGLVLKPYQSAQKQGAVGFFKGMAKGLTGVVVKPVTGVIDFASKTTQGLKNTALYLEDKPNQNRIRYPRVLYTQIGIVKQYDPIASKLISILKRPKNQQKLKVSNQPFMQYFNVGQNKFILVLSSTIILIRLDQQNILWCIPLPTIKMQKIPQCSFRIQGAPKNQQFWQKSINQMITFEKKEQADKFEKLIIDIKLNVGRYLTN